MTTSTPPTGQYFPIHWHSLANNYQAAAIIRQLHRADVLLSVSAVSASHLYWISCMSWFACASSFIGFRSWPAATRPGNLHSCVGPAGAYIYMLTKLTAGPHCSRGRSESENAFLNVSKGALSVKLWTCSYCKQCTRHRKVETRAEKFKEHLHQSSKRAVNLWPAWRCCWRTGEIFRFCSSWKKVLLHSSATMHFGIISLTCKGNSAWNPITAFLTVQYMSILCM